MLDLVANEVMRIASRFLEPACGDGNFLVEVLRRKLSSVEAQYTYKRNEYERITFLTISNLYGIDLLSDNIQACRERLFQIIDKRYTQLFGSQSNDRYRNAIQYVIKKNIVLGNTLNAQTIFLSEWILGKGDMVNRKEYSLASLIGPSSMDLFAGLENREYPIVHLLDLGRRKSPHAGK